MSLYVILIPKYESPLGVISPTIGIKAHGDVPIVLDQNKNDATQASHGYRCMGFP